MNITILSFVCDPKAGTEAGIGWRWAESYLELGHVVTILTHKSQEEHFDNEILDKHLKIYFLGSGNYKIPHAPTGLVDLLRMRSLYVRWLQTTHEFLEKSSFDLLQHVSWSTIRVVSPARIYGKKAILGPMGGGHKANISRIPNRDRIYEFIRNASVTVTILWQRLLRVHEYQPLVLVTNEETNNFARKVGYKRINLELADGIESDWIKKSARTIHSEKIRLLWAGRLVASKRPDLAISLLSKLIDSGLDCKLSIAGRGNQTNTLRKQAKKLKVEDQIDFLGQLSRIEMKTKLDDTDLVIFTSFRDSSCPIIIEAAARGVPTIAIRNQGVKTLVPENVATGPEGTLPIGVCLNIMHQAILQICKNGTNYYDSSSSCLVFARTQEWTTKARRVLQIMESLDA